MQLITNKLDALNVKFANDSSVFRPQFYRLKNEEDRVSFLKLLDTNGIQCYDYLFGTLQELIKTLNPSKKFNSQDLKSEALTHISPLTLEEYGVWVYYPWSNKLVHILDEEEFVHVRTSRNQYKITKEEQNILKQKKIGVIGLSVGQSVSLTLCMERICGEIRLADFDTLELTNLNRIRTGVYNLGLPKVYAVAREIAEIDPFISIKCFEDGINDSTMDNFFMNGGKLDLLIEESDGFDVKILSRHKAKQLQIPVLMEASDRCMVDVERFDIEPSRPILHGLVNHLDLNTLKSLKTTEEKIPYMLDILGLETSSVRLKASMLEIEQTINTWPQLASAVTMGGGITADVARRLLLGSFTESGRYHVDIEELIGNKNLNIKINPKEEALTHTDVVSLTQKVKFNINDQLSVPNNDLEKIVSAASTAPSGGNSQPWHWVYKNKTLLLYLAFDSNHTLMGHNNLASYVALGACIENALLKAKELKYNPSFHLFPQTDIPDLVASFTFSKLEESNAYENWLATGIETRLSNRKIEKRYHFSNEELDKIKAAVNKIEGASVSFFTSDEELQSIGEVLGEAEKLRLLEKLGHHDFVNEIRWTKEETETTRDGVDIRTVDLTNSELVGLKVAKDENVIDLVAKWNGGGAFKKLTLKSIESAGAVGVISMPSKSVIDYINGGRALQRAWICANLNNIAFHPTSASLFLYARLFNNGGGISEKGEAEFKKLRPQFEKVFNFNKDRGEIFIFRLLKADEPEIKSLRKPLNQIFKNLSDD
jgi:molybdopterin/thiamine biosynthesis adenylyltransferase